MKDEIKTNKSPSSEGVYSQALKVGNTIYFSGQLPIDVGTERISDNIKDQTKQCLENIKFILESCDCKMQSIVRCGIFLRNMEDIEVINEVYTSYFKSPFPVRVTVEVSRLPKDVQIEIDAIAYINE